jgi:hypothetical protein
LARLGSERHPAQDFLAAAGVQRHDLLQRSERHPVGRGIAERHVVELHRYRAVGHRDSAGFLADQRAQVEHLEHTVEADQRRHDVQPRSGQRGERE